MFGHIGFSYVGLIYLIMLFIPNILWARHKPDGYSADGENTVLQWMERIGQVCVTCCALIFSDYNPVHYTPWSLWLIASFVLMLLYEASWIRYFKGGRTMRDFYRAFIGIPVPLASLPVAAFLLLGIYGRVIWMLLSVITLGIGHIGIHIQHARRK